MSHWQKYALESTYYFIVDSKPAETVDNTKPDTTFCTAFVSTSSCINGAKESDLPWFKQYKECESLEESRDVVKKLIGLIMNGNFQNLYTWILSSKFSTIDKNGMAFLLGAEKEVPELSITGEVVKYKNLKFNLAKAKMLIWYNFCLCNMATSLVDKTLLWKQKRGIFMLDRLADSDKRIQEFMRMLMFETSLKELWVRCAEDHKIKPEYVGFEFPSHMEENGKLVPAKNSMQASLVDWIVLAAYAARNGVENRDPEFQADLINFITILDKKKLLNGMHFKGDITWN